jgi:oligosaccharide repeat unit polymerase
VTTRSQTYLRGAVGLQLRAGRYVAAFGYAVSVIGLTLLSSTSSVLLMAAVSALCFVAFVALWRPLFRPQLSYLDPGIMFLMVVLLYTCFPLVTLYAFDFRFGSSGDNRLNHIALSNDMIATVWSCANFIMAGFGSSYLAFRSARMPSLPAGISYAAPALWAGMIASAAVIATLYVLRGGGDYLEEYRFLAGLPTWVIQISNILTALFPASLFGLMVLHARQRPWTAISLALTSMLFFAVTSAARAPLVLIALGLLIAMDHFRKRIPLLALAAGAVVGLAAFLALGVIRGGGEFIGDAAGRTEFVSVFVTALDIWQLYVTGSTLDMNANLLLSDVFRLIPQQILAFEKVDPATWYVSTFYPQVADIGGGLAFGMVAESILGGGPWVALLRGAALGTLLSFALNSLTRRPSIWQTIIYMWLLATVYQCFRDTTFTLVGRFLFQFGPAVLILFLLSRLNLSERSTPVQSGSENTVNAHRIA